MDRKIPEEKITQIARFLKSHEREYAKTSGQYELIDDEGMTSPITDFLLSSMENAYNARSPYQSYFNEILSWFDVFDRSEDPYALFADIIERKLGTLKGKNIIEIGCGPVPALSRILSERMRNADGTIDGSITAYDPDLVIRDNELPGVRLVRSLFDKDTKIPDDAVIVSMTPVVEAVHVINMRVNTDKVSSIIKLGIIEGSDDSLALKENKTYGRMALSYEHSAYTGEDEMVISYIDEKKHGKGSK